MRRWRRRLGSCGARSGAGLAKEPDGSIQEKIDFEMRMQEGIGKLLAVSTQKDQVLHAVKNLMVCNARILAYQTELRREKEESTVNKTTGRCPGFAAKGRAACRGKVALSDLRIPLMWKGSDHFSNKDRTQRYSAFCLFKIGAQIFDTELVIVDKAITDICFESTTIFEEVGPEFQLKVEVYSCCCTEESSALTNTPKKLVKKLKTSVGKATGKNVTSGLDDCSAESLLLNDAAALGAKYSLLAYTTLGLENVKDSFKTHSFTVVGNEESSFWLPLYGSMCCRLVVQPSCMINDMMTGFLNQQQIVGNLPTWRKLYCVLRGGKLLCYYAPEEIKAQVEPALAISVNKETTIRSVDKDTQHKTCNFSITNPKAGEAVTQIFAAERREDLYKWMEAFWQHFYDFSQWKHCCEEFMTIEIMSPRKPPLFLTREATSVYQDINIDSPVKHEGLIDIVQRRIEETDGEFVIGQQQDCTPPHLWAAMFDGSHQTLVQKSMIPGTSRETVNLKGKGKKRRAPLPPTNKPPYSSVPQTSSEQLGKENIGNNYCGTCWDLDSEEELSSEHRSERPIAPPRKHLSSKELIFSGIENSVLCGDQPVPAPRNKSVKDILEPRFWFQSQGRENIILPSNAQVVKS